MPKTYYIPTSDHDFLVWCDHFVSNLSAEMGVSEADLNALKAINDAFRTKTAAANDAAALAKQAVSDKNACRRQAEILIRAEVRRIKARADYVQSLGQQLGIEGAELKNDMETAMPSLSVVDKTGGKVVVSFNKYHSDGINLYCQRENDNDWMLLGRATQSPYVDQRPLLQAGKPELRRYSAVFMQHDQEVGNFSNDVVVSCSP